MIRKSQLALAIAALISAPAFAAVGWDANIELDTTYQNTARDNSATPSVMKARGESWREIRDRLLEGWSKDEKAKVGV